MKEKIEFSLDLYKTGKYDVVTREGKLVEIKFTDGRERDYPIRGYIGTRKDLDSWNSIGRYKPIIGGGREQDDDLFLVEKAEQPKEQTEVDEALVWAAMIAVKPIMRTKGEGFKASVFIPIEEQHNTEISGEGSTPYAVAIELYKKLKGE